MLSTAKLPMRKKSQRYLSGTFNTVAVLLVLFVAANRLVAPEPGNVMQRRPSDAQLEALRDFSVIWVHGDFDLTIEQGVDFSVGYAAVSEQRGYLTVGRKGDALSIAGYGNRADGQAAQVTVTLPVLVSLEVESGDGAMVSVNGISTPALLKIHSTETLRLTNISSRLTVNATAVGNIVLDAQSAANTVMTVSSGGTRITQSPAPVL